MTRTFRRHKETKGTWQYQEVDEQTGVVMCGALYLKKGAMPDTDGRPVAPETLTVTIEEV